VLDLYKLSTANPLIVQNPRALWMITRDVFKALGRENFADLVPEPPDLGLPKNPREEWTAMLQGEDVEVHPMDNDDLHLVDHGRRLEEHNRSQAPDEDAINRMVAHILAHKAAKRQKMLMQALTQQLMSTVSQGAQALGGGGMGGLGGGGMGGGGMAMEAGMPLAPEPAELPGGPGDE
jgi:hypothetical protein